QDGRKIPCYQHFPPSPLVSHLPTSGNTRKRLTGNRCIARSGNDHRRLEAGCQPDQGSTMDRFQILKPLPRHRLSGDGPRLLGSSTLENYSGPSNLFQEILNDNSTMRMTLV